MFRPFVLPTSMSDFWSKLTQYIILYLLTRFISISYQHIQKWNRKKKNEKGRKNQNKRETDKDKRGEETYEKEQMKNGRKRWDKWERTNNVILDSGEGHVHVPGHVFFFLDLSFLHKTNSVILDSGKITSMSRLFLGLSFFFRGIALYNN